MILVADKISKSYIEGEGLRLPVLEGLSLAVEEGEVVAVTGESGVGKSTLLHLLGLLDRPDSGVVLFKGQDTSQLDDVRLSAVRNREIGFIFQFHHLLPEFDAAENIAMPARIAGLSPEDAANRTAKLLDTIGLSQRASHFPNALSGGEQQRVALARALVNKPSLIFADEPTGNLDAKNERRLIKLLFGLSKERGTAVILATHNRDLAAMADRAFLLENRTLSEFPAMGSSRAGGLNDEKV